ncbi:hypothetical protein [Rosistilla oblonga]|uniref:hypothetical protein n=1 Tax=Rosistilla oblonga TaxID=2527990 RepID=UPI003A976D0E
MNDDAVYRVYREAIPLQETTRGLYGASADLTRVVTPEDYFRSVPLFAEPMVKPNAHSGPRKDTNHRTP